MKLYKDLKILYVEDSRFANKMGVSVLSLVSDHVHAEHNGADAYEYFIKYKPDIIFTDLDMPGMTGCELISKIRKLDKKTPVVIVSAMDWVRSLDVNVIPKPITLNLVKAVLNGIMSGRLRASLHTEENLTFLAKKARGNHIAS
ncbi:MAG: response regulator [Deferribacterales bacterium]